MVRMRCWSAAATARPPRRRCSGPCTRRGSSESWSGPLAAGVDHTVDHLVPPAGRHASQLAESDVRVHDRGRAHADRLRHRRAAAAGDARRTARQLRRRGPGTVLYLMTVRGGATGLEQALAGQSHLSASGRLRRAHALPLSALSGRLRALACVTSRTSSACCASHSSGRRSSRCAPVSTRWRSRCSSRRRSPTGSTGIWPSASAGPQHLGRFLDPLADKLLLVALFVQCAWLALVPWWLTAAVVARDVMIGAGALIFRLWFGPLHGRPDPHQQGQHGRAAALS